jgi:hypothetical protein
VPEPEPALVLEPGLGPAPGLERVAAGDRGVTAGGGESVAAAVVVVAAAAAIPAADSAAGVGYGADADVGADARRRAARAASWLRGWRM